MRAIGFRRYGPPEVLEALELPRAEPGPSKVLIRVAASGVNPADWALRGGQLRLFVRLKLPFVPGSDVAGVVEAVGPGVTCVGPGEAVYAMTPAMSGAGTPSSSPWPSTTSRACHQGSHSPSGESGHGVLARRGGFSTPATNAAPGGADFLPEGVGFRPPQCKRS